MISVEQYNCNFNKDQCLRSKWLRAHNTTQIISEATSQKSVNASDYSILGNVSNIQPNSHSTPIKNVNVSSENQTSKSSVPVRLSKKGSASDDKDKIHNDTQNQIVSGTESKEESQSDEGELDSLVQKLYILESIRI